MFLKLWRAGLDRYDELKGLDWSWLSMDVAMTKAPLGGEKTGPNPTDRGKGGVKRSLLTEASRVPVGLAVHGAIHHDMKLVRGTHWSMLASRHRYQRCGPDWIKGMCSGQEPAPVLDTGEMTTMRCGHTLEELRLHRSYPQLLSASAKAIESRAQSS